MQIENRCMYQAFFPILPNTLRSGMMAPLFRSPSLIHVPLPTQQHRGPDPTTHVDAPSQRRAYCAVLFAIAHPRNSRAVALAHPPVHQTLGQNTNSPAPATLPTPRPAAAPASPESDRTTHANQGKI